MKGKLKEYIDTVFADAERRAPDHLRVRELKEEILQNIYDRYDDQIALGRTPAAAYNIAIAGVGDVTDLLDDVVGAPNGTERAESDMQNPSVKRPLNAEELETVRRYKSRSAVIVSVSVAMYTRAAVPAVSARSTALVPTALFA